MLNPLHIVKTCEDTDLVKNHLDCINCRFSQHIQQFRINNLEEHSALHVSIKLNQYNSNWDDFL